ncbi:MAG TPA: hypothetical protein VGX91_13595 [Candidatus Cybelea sp.]|jgi:hypothetical protein|nr:hypothetical protein [Candidatus Cybelea sp.]
MAASASIDHLVLEVPGGSADAGRELALLVAAGLGEAGALPQAGDLPTLRVLVTGDAHTDNATLAHRIVAATLRGLALAP